MIRQDLRESILKHFAALLEVCGSYGERRLASHIESAVIASTPPLAYRKECGSIGRKMRRHDTYFPLRKAWQCRFSSAIGMLSTYMRPIDESRPYTLPRRLNRNERLVT